MLHLHQIIEILPPAWKQALSPLQNENYFKDLAAFLKTEYQSHKVIYPNREHILRAIQELDLPDVKVVIIGQDPYHGPGQAIGRCFAVPNELFPKPPSLQNITKELQSDLGLSIPKDQSDLSGWARQGVLLLNTVLTVEGEKPLSHRDRGWERFTEQMIRELGHREKPMVFILWGSHAQKLKTHIDLKRHEVIESAHPSPLSAYRGFLGSKPFSRTNATLVKWGLQPINWQKISN